MFNKDLKISPLGIQLIQHFESCELTAYPDSGGVWTIGWGSTVFNGKPVREGLVITQEQANEQFTKDLEKFELLVKERVKRDLKDFELAAAVSFAYNAGTMYKNKEGKWQPYLLWENINKGLKGDAMFKYWSTLATTVNGVVLKGLVKRRTAEVRLFQTGKLRFK